MRPCQSKRHVQSSSDKQLLSGSVTSGAHINLLATLGHTNSVNFRPTRSGVLSFCPTWIVSGIPSSARDRRSNFSFTMKSLSVLSFATLLALAHAEVHSKYFHLTLHLHPLIDQPQSDYDPPSRLARLTDTPYQSMPHNLVK